MSEAPQDTRLPHGALIVVAVGLLACVVAALLTTAPGSGEAAHLEWVQTATVPDSQAATVPSGKETMQLVSGGIRATGTNVSGYSLFRIASVLRVGAGAPVGGGHVLCSVAVAQGTEIAKTSGGLRATYPRSSENGIYGQEVPETILVKFSSHGSELAVLEVGDLPRRFTTERGVKLEWPKDLEVGTEHLKYSLPAGKPKQDLELPFDTVWKTTAIPAARIACTLTTGAGKATVRTHGSLKKISPPINEQQEAEKEEAEEEKKE